MNAMDLLRFYRIFIAITMLSFSFLIPVKSSASEQLTTLEQTNIETIHAKAREMVKKGDLKEALSLLTPFASEPMRYPAIYSDYLVIFIWDRRQEDAIRLYERLPSRFPRNAYLLRNIARAYYNREDFSRASLLYKDSLGQNPSDEEALKGLIFSLIKIGASDIASDYIEEFLKKSPDSTSISLIKAHLLILQDRFTEALKTYDMLLKKRNIDAENIYKSREDLITSLPQEKRQAMLSVILKSIQDGDSTVIPDYILVLILNKDYRSAISTVENTVLDAGLFSENLLYWIGWAYFKTGNIEKAKFYYQKVLASKPEYARALIGLSYCLATEGKGDEAIKTLDRLMMIEPNNIEVRFARAFAYEKEKRFLSAIQEYDRILEISGENPVAKRLRIRDFSDLGARSYALKEANWSLHSDTELQKSIEGDMAVDLIAWDEPLEAIDILLPKLEDRENLRARFDYMVALAENNSMKEVVMTYEEMVKEGITPPSYVLENVAKAYLYLEEPEKALEVYNEALKMNPVSFNGRMGKFYVLQELRRWEEAKKILDDLDKETPETTGEGKNIRPNWPKLEIALTRGWFLLYEERFSESQDFFYNLYEKAPANIGTRTGLAHVYLWRGWPRKALREFRIIETLDPKESKSLIGKISTLNMLAFKEQAREEASDLLSIHPENKHLKQLIRSFEVENMRELFTDIVYTKEEGGYEDIRTELSLSQPLSLYTRLYGFFLRQKTWDSEHAGYYRRAGIGINHIFDSSWSIRQQFSINYDNGEDFGSLTTVNFNPDDYWRFNLSYDSYTTDVPLRARIYGIEAEKYEIGTVYRESDWRDYYLTLSQLKFSDGNRRDQVLLGHSHGLWVKSDWKMRLLFDLYMSRNSLKDAPYFNPSHDYSLSATHLTEHTLYRIYNQAFVHRLFLTLGTYKQSGYSNETIGSIRYEHAYDFSDTQAMVLGLMLKRNVYDGEPVDSSSLYLTYRGRF